MKKLLVLIGLVVFFLQNSEAQVLRYGVKAGINLSNINVNPEADPPAPTMRFGVHFGGTLKYELSEKFNLAPELIFSWQGGNDSDPDVDQFVKLTYLNIPIMAEYHINENIYVHAGPQLGFLIGGDLLEEDKVDKEQDLVKANDLMKTFDFSLGFGAGYLLDNGLEIALRYNLGLTNINNDKLGIAFYEPLQEVKNRVFQASVAYNFGSK